MTERYREGLWQVTILQDRYGGTYSGGSWLAVADSDTAAPDGRSSRVRYVDSGASGGDCECSDFWGEVGDVWWIGKGETPDEALADLHHRCDVKDGCVPVRAVRGVPVDDEDGGLQL